ncbi:RTC4-like domain-containing protein [Mycena filopes]|nr:RTC4-like domain-containing protein [Mycena filopes]
MAAFVTFPFSGSRQQRTKGFDVRSLEISSSQRTKKHPFPLSAEDLPSRKKVKYADEKTVVLARDYEFSNDKEDLAFLAPGVDPKSLCPYCDRPLPEKMSQKLEDLLERTFLRSYTDDRPANPLGRKASVAVYAAVCKRHVFESKLVPKAVANGWATTIDWTTLKGRVFALRGDLEAIMFDRGREIAYQGKELNQTAKSSGPRMECIFWQEILSQLEAEGSRRTTGVTGYFGVFDKIQPGYYGEVGAIIIHETLYEMFQISKVEPEAVQPLNVHEFIGRILVPEVATRLIMEDMGISIEEKQRAVAIMRESCSYGVAMFPVDDDEAE